MADGQTRERRQQVRLRISLGQHRAAMKNQVHAILHQHGKRAPVTDTFGRRGRQWLAQVSLPPVAREALNRYGALIEQLGQHIQCQDQQLKKMAGADPRAKCLASIPGIGAYSAMIILAELGDLQRFRDKKALFSYAGLAPAVRELQRCKGRRQLGVILALRGPCLRWGGDATDKTLCALSTNSSLSHRPQRFLWAGTPVFIEG